jgi:hypothetical protein
VESGGSSVGKVGECDVASRCLQGCSPRLCQLEIDGLAPVSKYWTYQSHGDIMGPVNRCSLFSIDAWFSLLLQWLSWERNWVADQWICQPVCWGLCWETFFSGVVGSIQHCWWLAKGCHVCVLPTGTVRVAYVDWHGKCTCHVYWIFPYRVYIDSNHRDPQIRVPLVCGRQQVANYCNIVINELMTWL